MAYEFFKHIFDKTDEAAATYVSSTVADVIAAVDPVAQRMLLLYVLLWGIAAYRGLINEYIMDGVFRIVKVVLVISIATQVGLYSDLIANNFIALPDYLSRLVGGGDLTTSSKNTLDKILSDGLDTGKVFWEQGSLNPLDMDIGPLIMAVFTWFAVFVCTAYAGFLMVLSKMALSVLVGLGPIFIIMLMFDSTKKFFESWLGQVINFALVSALTIGVVKLIFGVLASVAESSKAAAADPASEIGILTIASLIIISVISFLVMLQVMGIASGLGGGMALSTLGAAGAMMSKAKGAVGAANRRTTDRERRDPTTWTGAARERVRQRVAASWANRKPPGDNSISKAS